MNDQSKIPNTSPSVHPPGGKFPRVGWIVLIVALLERVGLWVLYKPVQYSDSGSYWRLAEAVRSGFKGYDGTRTPGYPVFLALVGSDEIAWLAQMVAGVIITLLLFYIAWQLGQGMEEKTRSRFSLLVGLSHTLNLGQLFFEANILTETLTTFWIMAALAVFCYGLRQPRRRRIWLAGLVGLASGLAAIVRPLFIFLPPWLLLFMIFMWQEQPLVLPRLTLKSWMGPILRTVGSMLKSTWEYILFLTIPAVLVVGSYAGFLHARFGEWGLTVMTGYHLIQNTGTFFEYVPDQYAALRDTYIKYRDQHIAQNGTQTNTIWDAIPEMQKVSGLGFTDLSTTLVKISVQLILAHPDLYLRNALEGWWLFWRAPFYWSADAVRYPALVPALKGLVLFERVVLLAGNMAFLLASLLAVFFPSLRRLWKLSPLLWLLIGAVWVTSIVQTLLDHGDNPRFLIPVQSLVVIVLLWIGTQMLPVLKKAGGEKSS